MIVARNVTYDIPGRQEFTVNDSQGADAALGKNNGYMTPQGTGPK